jgi:outer membrane protein TolC
VTLALFGALAAWLRWSRYGQWLRAVGENQQAARTMGFPVARIRLVAFAVGGLIAGVAGPLFSSKAGVSFESGLSYSLFGFIALVIGGTGSVWGPLAGGLFLAALQAYYSAQAAQAAVISATEAERSARESYQAADARYGVGVATPADRLQAQTALSQATLNRIRAEGEARNGLGALANALGFAAQQSIVLAELPAELPATSGELAFQKEIDALIAEAQARRPDLRAAEAQLKAAEASVDIARSQGRPSVSLAAGPSWQNTAGVVAQGGSVGLTLNVPIFTGFDTTYRVRSAAALADVRAAQRDRIRNQIALDVWRAYQSLTTATQSLKTTADLVASAEQSARVALGRYKAGVGTVLDLLTAQSALASARLQRIQAQLDWNVYRATLAQAMGALDYTLLQAAAEGRP